MKDLAAPALSTHDVAKLVGVSYRQLDYWCRRGLIPGQRGVCPGSGGRRLWRPNDVQRARVISMAARLKSLPMEQTIELLEREFDMQYIAGELGATVEQAGVA